MSVPLGCARLCVSEQVADDRQTETGACTDARETVTQVVNAGIFDTGPFADGSPRPVKVGARRLFFRASRFTSNHIYANAR